MSRRERLSETETERTGTPPLGRQGRTPDGGVSEGRGVCRRVHPGVPVHSVYLCGSNPDTLCVDSLSTLRQDDHPPPARAARPHLTPPALIRASCDVTTSVPHIQPPADYVKLELISVYPQGGRVWVGPQPGTTAWEYYQALYCCQVLYCSHSVGFYECTLTCRPYRRML